MTSADMARGHLRQARRILAEAERHAADGAWSLAVRRCQEAVELALKAALRFAGVEVPRVHDVGVFLVEHVDRLPTGIAVHMERLASISRRLRQEREVSFYGDDEVAAPPDRLYAKGDATDALRDAGFVVALVEAHFPPLP